MRTRDLLTVLVGVALTAPVVAAEPDGHMRLLAEVSDRHRAALDAIRTVSFAFERSTLKDEPMHYEMKPGGGLAGGEASHETGPGRHWQTPERWRSSALWSDGSTWDETCRHDHVICHRSAATNGSTRPAELTREPVTAWSRHGRDRLAPLLFGHQASDSFAAVPFHHLIEQPRELMAAERLPGGEVRVELSHPEGKYEFWFSPRHGHLIRKRVWQPFDQSQHRHEAEVTHFAEPNPGQFFPTTVEYRSFEKDALKQHGRLALTELQVNRPIPNETIRIPGIAGMVCKNYTHQRNYRVDADGYRVGDPVIDAAESDHTRSLNINGTSTGHPPSPAPDGPLPWWVWAAFGCLTLCLFAAGMEIYRLRTSARTDTPSV